MAWWSPDWAQRFPATHTRAVDDLTTLALAAASGDRVALAAFVRRTQPEVWRVCARLGDRAEADDLTQEVYLRAIPALKRFRADASARTWLLQIARHVCADHVRRRTRRRALLGRLSQGLRADEEPVVSRAGEVEIDDAIAALGARPSRRLRPHADRRARLRRGGCRLRGAHRDDPVAGVACPRRLVGRPRRGPRDGVRVGLGARAAGSAGPRCCPGPCRPRWCRHRAGR